MRREDQGFTIIEVLIVLAIAVIILSLVFISIAALNRNVRNNSRKSDANRIIVTLQDFYNNNSRLPGVDNNGITDTINNSYWLADCTTIAGSTGKLNYFDISSFCSNASADTTNKAFYIKQNLFSSNAPGLSGSCTGGCSSGLNYDFLAIFNHASCGDKSGTYIHINYVNSLNSLILIYPLETATSPWTLICNQVM